MKRRIYFFFLIIALLLSSSISTHAREQYVKAFSLNYSSSKLASRYNCNLCHGKVMEELNRYGEDIDSILKTKDVSVDALKYALGWCEPLDSDKDGFSNIMEITLNTNPGNPKDFPSLDLFEGVFKLTAPLSTPRYLHTVTLLSDGRVLAAGGSREGYDIEDSAEVFDPETNTWSSTGKMKEKRWCHTATLLLDGRVLIIGGCDGAKKSDRVLSTAELYDPKTGKFTYTGSLNIARQYHTATLLKDGRVLIAGGGDSASLADTRGIKSAEIYDPNTGKFTLTGTLVVPRQYHRATLLANGKVLITGGSTFSTTSSIPIVEIYDPEKGKFSVIKPMNQRRVAHAATLLSDGRVLIAGGSFPRFQDPQRSAEIYDHEKGEFILTGNMLDPMLDFDGILLDDGKVLLPGGARQGPMFKSGAEIYDPKAGKFTFTAPMSETRDVFNPVKLKDGRVIICGGVGSRYKFLSLSEVYVPGPLSQAEGIRRSLEFGVGSKIVKNIEEIILSIKDKKYEVALERFEKGVLGKINDEEINPKLNLFSKTLTKLAKGNKLPEVFIDAKPKEGKIPLKINFTAKASDPDGSIVSYIWDFGDGVSSTLQDVEHTFTCKGEYNVKLRAIDDWGDNSSASLTVKAKSEKPGISFKCDVMPILNARCVGCHGARGGLSVTSYADIIKGGRNGSSVIPGKPEESLLIKYIVDPVLRMPPRGEGVPKEELTILKEWIKQGAKEN